MFLSGAQHEFGRAERSRVHGHLKVKPLLPVLEGRRRPRLVILRGVPAIKVGADHPAEAAARNDQGGARRQCCMQRRMG